MNIFTAPFYSLFSRNFYRQAAHTSLGKCFLYLAFISFVGTLTFFVLLMVSVLPKVNEFVDWAKGDMPSLTWTPEGLTANTPMPYTMTYPQFGPLITFDLSRVDLSAETMGSTPVFVTSKKIFTKGTRGEVRIFDLVQVAARARSAPSAVQIDGDWLQRLYGTAMPWFIVFITSLMFVVYFVWKLLAVVLYSWVGLLINFFRRTKLAYEEIFKISIFAITPWFLMQSSLFFTPFLNRILPPKILCSLIVTTVYLFLAIKMTEEGPTEGQASS